MKTTRIAGTPHDQRHANLVRQTARIYSYTRHIRRLAADAQTSPVEPTPLPAPDATPVGRVPTRGALQIP